MLLTIRLKTGCRPFDIQIRIVLYWWPLCWLRFLWWPAVLSPQELKTLGDHTKPGTFLACLLASPEGNFFPLVQARIEPKENEPLTNQNVATNWHRIFNQRFVAGMLPTVHFSLPPRCALFSNVPLRLISELSKKRLLSDRETQV